MTRRLRIFVSYSDQDNAFCHSLVQALRHAGADVWCEEHSQSRSVRWRELIQIYDLYGRPVFLVVLSSAACATASVQEECARAYNHYLYWPTRVLLPVVGATYHPGDVAALGRLAGLSRIEAPDHQPLPPDEAARRLLHLLALMPAGEDPAPVAPQATESVDDLLIRGKALLAQQRTAEAMSFFERVTQCEPTSYDAWVCLALTLDELGRSAEAQAALEHAVAVFDAYDAVTWTLRGIMQRTLEHWHEALAAYDQALALDPTYVTAWIRKGDDFRHLERNAEALAAYDAALTVEPTSGSAWRSKVDLLLDLGRYVEALALCEQALAQHVTGIRVRINKGKALDGLGRYTEALAVWDEAIASDPYYPNGYVGKAITLRKLGRTKEAEEIEQRARKPG